jgi:NAD(P)-dependent dehydrogenase (short-subunit alcohol dehydrogenase family)
MTVDTLSLEGKIAIVSGSGRENGMGAAIAMLLAKNGAFVTINYVSESSASRADVVATKIRENGGKAIVVKASVESPAGAKFLVNETLRQFKTDRIDILGIHYSIFAQLVKMPLTIMLSQQCRYQRFRGNNGPQ